MDIRWCKHLEGDKKAEFEALIRNSRQVLNRLFEILEDEERSIGQIECTTKDFQNPNWAYLQAFRNGKRSGYKDIKDILDLRSKS